MKALKLVTMLCLAVSISAVAADEDAIDAAQAAATAWLATTDALQYEESWSAASSLFQAAVSKDDWKRSLGAARGPLGELVSRKLATAKYATALPGAPDGEYVVMTFDTVFEHKQKAVETVTVMLDRDANWRVSGYYIR